MITSEVETGEGVEGQEVECQNKSGKPEVKLECSVGFFFPFFCFWKHICSLDLILMHLKIYKIFTVICLLFFKCLLCLKELTYTIYIYMYITTPHPCSYVVHENANHQNP